MENLSIKKVLTKLLSTKMVIESGTSTKVTSGYPTVYWTWRKWSDGTAECWGYTDIKSYVMSSASGNGYYTHDNAYLPPNLFTTVDAAIADRKQGTGNTPNNTLVTINVNSIDTSSIGYWVQTTGSYTQSLAVTLYVVGQWATRETDPENPDYQLLNIDGFVQNQMSKAEVQALIEASGNIFKENDTWIPSNLT